MWPRVIQKQETWFQSHRRQVAVGLGVEERGLRSVFKTDNQYHWMMVILEEFVAVGRAQRMMYLSWIPGGRQINVLNKSTSWESEPPDLYVLVKCAIFWLVPCPSTSLLVSEGKAFLCYHTLVTGKETHSSTLYSCWLGDHKTALPLYYELCCGKHNLRLLSW